MENKQPALSLLRIAALTFKVLSSKQRQSALMNLVGSIGMALLEVISLAVVIPLFFKLINFSDNAFLDDLLILFRDFSWQSIVGSIILLFVVKNIVSLWITRQQSQFIHYLFVELSEQLYRTFYTRTWINFTGDNSIDVVRRIKHTPSDFTNYIIQGFLNLITDIIIFLFMLIALVWIDYRIVLVIISLSTPIILCYYWFRKNVLTKIDNSFRQLTPRGNILLMQGIDSFVEVKIYHKQNFFINQFMSLNRRTSQSLADLKFSANVPTRLFETLGVLSFASVITFYKIFPIYQSNLLVLLGLLSVAVYKLVPSLNRMFISLSQIQAYAYTVPELQESLIFNETINTFDNASVFFEKTIELKDVSFRYIENAKESLFTNVNATIIKGDFVVVEGASGVGKTTLIHILTGLITNYQGSILIDKSELNSINLTSWQLHLGYVPQASVLLSGTVLDNVAFGEEKKDISLPNVEHALKLAELYDFIQSTSLKIYTPIGENGLTLSGGQRQRLLLARALYCKPKVLLLDEFTNQLDESNKEKILNSLKELSKNGTTIIIGSHDHAVQKFATRRLVVKDTTIYEVTDKQPSTAK